ncbi:hypothetical protein JSY14_07220 [Brachybacterium sp. EF45031]|uniref:hypothetical protein n=1 Tax=Brachybacterium sillae TaxID=2810536 RepID=UPI00217F0126|nr:hypothetical protein [Brachybacterium sillae]MCS6711821.1 hypothetical protein [Brachybacterium sillae]
MRDHDLARYEERKEVLRRMAAELQQGEPRARVQLEIEDVYANIADAAARG